VDASASRDDPTPSTDLVPVSAPEPVEPSTAPAGATGRWYQGRRRLRTGVVGWLRGLGPLASVLVGTATVALLGGLAWWAGGMRPGTPPLPAPLPAAPALSAVVSTAASPLPSPSPTVRRSTSAPPRSPAPTTPAASTVPSSQPPAQRTRYEAEVASIGNGTPTREHPGYSGSGYVDFGSAAGSFVQWRVTVPAGGRVTLVIGYANGDFDQRPCDVSVNGAVVQRGLAFPSTGDWARWGTRTLTVVLPAGASEIRVTATTSAGGPNIDYLDVQT
jgi:Carbohydrate binding module (family 35)